VNSNLSVPLPEDFKSRLVAPSADGYASGYSVVLADVIDETDPRKHSSKKLAQGILRIYYDRSHQEQTRRDESEHVVVGDVRA
jgi:hypothetical protein